MYFYGYKVHCITAADGASIEFEFSPGKRDDKVGFSLLNFDLPEGSDLFADKAYNWHTREDELQQVGIQLQPIRKKNSKKADNTYASNWLRKQYRRHIETDISQLERLFPQTLHAVTSEGFLFKLVGFMVAHNNLLAFWYHTT